ncbi:uncharacterized protein LOC141598733 isoform X1 [Silene latifolia]|uniref:uncharacterized protein LOC141598733 isoform X1 n=1 Tax=Silene latifolia TaxID=37657 RepID=UPI003D786E4B
MLSHLFLSTHFSSHWAPNIIDDDEYFHTFTVPHVSLYVKKTWQLSVVAQCSSEVQANAADTLCAITRNMGSPLTAKVCSLGFVSRIFSHALEDSSTKSGLVHSLFISISLLDPRWSSSSLLMHSLRGQHMYEAPIAVNPETTNTMLPRLDLRVRVSIDEIKNVKEV